MTKRKQLITAKSGLIKMVMVGCVDGTVFTDFTGDDIDVQMTDDGRMIAQVTNRDTGEATTLMGFRTQDIPMSSSVAVAPGGVHIGGNHSGNINTGVQNTKDW